MPGVSHYTNTIDEGGDFPPESGRYHLYTSLGCPFACRAHHVLALKGLTDTVSITMLHPVYQKLPGEETKTGWAFRRPDDAPLTSSEGYGSFDCPEATPDVVCNKNFLKEIYMADKGEPNKHFSVPVLFDKKTKKIVSNDSADIMEIFNKKFDKWAKNPKLNLYKEENAAVTKELEAWIPLVISALYKAGFAKTQTDYDNSCDDFFKGLSRINDEVLAKSKYLTGNEIAGLDIKLYVLVIRWVLVYCQLFKINGHSIQDYPNILRLIRDLYQLPEIHQTTNFKHIQQLYWGSMVTYSPYAIIPQSLSPSEMKALLEQKS
eukprot:Filipodium_phascolosomae@DN2924_c0_g1_i1.p1